MRLQQIRAIPHPCGNRIRLHWQNPASTLYAGVRIVRRQDTHPTAPHDGIVVAEGEGLETAEDSNLKDEVVYYYTLFPYSVNPVQYHFDSHNRTAAMATTPYNMAGQLYDLLPSIYHRYDTASGELRRFLDSPGNQFDQLYSFATALLNLYDRDRVNGGLLPLLADWIGWQTNFRLEIAKQRNEIRSAPYLYQAMGLIPTLEATVKRIIGWESRTKEFVHNVLRSNCPERLNLWVRQRQGNGVWSQPINPLSLNFAYEGRPCAVRGADGRLWLFYHTLKREQWEIWFKTYPKSDHPTEAEWTPSQPLIRDRSIQKYPTAALQGTKLWVFWSTYLEAEQRWQLSYCICTHAATGDAWSEVQRFSDDRSNCRQPWAVTDANQGLWLFWIEQTEARSHLKYNRHNGTTWELAKAASVSLASEPDPRVESDVFVLVHSTDTGQTLWVFWSRQEPAGFEGGTPQTRWQIAYRVKQGLDPAVTSDWSEVRTLPWAALGNDDREPTALVRDDGAIEVFWSSTRNGSWSIWHGLLNPTTRTWETVEPITTGAYSHRAPLCVADPGGTFLIYRSNESLSYGSQVYGATETIDFRYAGCTTVDTRNQAKTALREKFDDFQTYTYVVHPQKRPTKSEDWYAWYVQRDTVGLYLTPTTEDPDLQQRDQELLRNVLPQFLPISTRVEFFFQPVEVEEAYDATQRVTEVAGDVGILNDTELYSGGADVASDRIPEWQLFMTNSLAHRTIDQSTSPTPTHSRTWHAAITYD